MGFAAAAAIVGANKQDRSSTAVIGNNASPYINAYTWTAAGGFGSKYSNPATIPSGAIGRTVMFNPTKSYLAMNANGATPYTSAYLISTDARVFGSRLTPASGPGSATDSGSVFAPNNAIYATGDGSTPYLDAWPWTNSNGFGTKFTAPTAASASGRGICFGKSSTSLFVSSSGVGYSQAWRITNTGFGTKYTNPSGTYNGTNATGVDVNTNNTAVLINTDQNPWVNATPWVEGTGFGTKYTNPSPLPGGGSGGNGAISLFSKRMDRVLVTGNGTSPYIDLYKWNNATGFGTKYAGPSSAPTSGVIGSAVSDDDLYFLIAITGSPYVYAYTWTVAGGFGARYPNPSTPIGSQGYSAAFN